MLVPFVYLIVAFPMDNTLHLYQ